MTEVAVKVGAGGRVVIPGELRAALGIEPGDTLILVSDGDEMRLLTPRQAVRRAQAILRRRVHPGLSLVDELLRERAAEGRDG